MKYLLLPILVFLMMNEVTAQTKVVVRTKAKDAKFIGSSIGGAKIIIREALTGEILAQGLTEGSTGNTDLIMREPHERYKNLSDDKTAKFETSLNIDEPVFVTIEAIAPVNKKQAAIKATTQQWIIPGEDITGDGITIEIPGFVVDILSPQTHESVVGSKVEITANVVMMCGCPLTSGGLWDADKIDVKVIIHKDRQAFKTMPLAITSKNNTFSTVLDNLEAGLYEITVYASDSRTGNTGIDKVNVILQ